MLLGAAAACVILLSFAAEDCKSDWSGCIQAAIMICRQIFALLAPLIFLLNPVKKCFKIVFFLLWRRDPSCFGAAISDAVARSSIVFCNLVSADRIVMAALRMLGAAAACVIEGSLEVKLPTIWTDEKQSRAEGERRERLEERRSEKRKSQKKEDADARKGRKVAKHCVFPMICGSGGSKSRLAKAAGAEPAGQMRDEKLHAVVARSTFPSQNVQNTPFSDHFWKLRCRKSARRCGAKHISKSKCPKHLSFGPLLEVEMSKKCTPLWREAHFQVKMYKAHQVRTTFGS